MVIYDIAEKIKKRKPNVSGSTLQKTMLQTYEPRGISSTEPVYI